MAGAGLAVFVGAVVAEAIVAGMANRKKEVRLFEKSNAALGFVSSSPRSMTGGRNDGARQAITIAKGANLG